MSNLVERIKDLFSACRSPHTPWRIRAVAILAEAGAALDRADLARRLCLDEGDAQAVLNHPCYFRGHGGRLVTLAPILAWRLGLSQPAAPDPLARERALLAGCQNVSTVCDALAHARRTNGHAHLPSHPERADGSAPGL